MSAVWSPSGLGLELCVAVEIAVFLVHPLSRDEFEDEVVCQEDIEFVRYFFGSSLFCHQPFALCLKRRARLTHAPQLPATAGQHDGCLPQANGSKRRGGYNLRLPVHPRPPPKTSLRLIQHPAPLFFTSKYDFFSPSEMDGGSDGVSFVRKGRGEDRGQRCGGREEIGGGAGRGEGNNITHVLAGVSD
ncbi:unnamed protein product [Leuciscus chuanchicus]